MDKFQSALAYVVRKIPLEFNEFSVSLVLKILYLSDWKFAIDYGKQITEIEWKVSKVSLPIDDDLEKSVSETFRLFKSVKKHSKSNYYPDTRDLSSMVEDSSLQTEEIAIIDFILRICILEGVDSIIKITFSTYPFLKMTKDDGFDLIKLAKEYKLESV
jgi:hypothetical protein